MNPNLPGGVLNLCFTSSSYFFYFPLYLSYHQNIIFVKIDFSVAMLHRNDKAQECQVGKGKAGAERPLSLSPNPMN